VLTESNGFETGAAYDASGLNGVGGNIPYNATPPYNDFTISGMRFGYSGDGNGSGMLDEYLTIDPVTEDLVVLSVGSGLFSLQGQWDFMPDAISADDPIPITKPRRRPRLHWNGSTRRSPLRTKSARDWAQCRTDWKTPSPT
jgi:flagellin